MTYIAQFMLSRRGSVAITTGLLSIVLLGSAGFAIDASRAVNARAELQHAADSAALAAVVLLPDRDLATERADSLAITNAKDALGDVSPEVGVSFGMNSEGEDESVIVEMSLGSAGDGGFDTFFGGLTGVDAFTISVSAEAALTGETKEPVCLLALHPTLKHIMFFLDESSIVAPDCHVYSNSNHDHDAIDPRTEQPVITKSIGTMGGGHNNLWVLDPPFYWLDERLPDPFADMGMPSDPGGCEGNDLELAENENKTISAGAYCGGIVLGKNATLTLNPGLYYVKEGDLEVEDGGRIQGDGVTIYLAEDVRFNSENMDFDISAPASGPYQGMALIAERRLTDDGDVDFGGFRHEVGFNEISVEGVIYMPNGDWHITLHSDLKPADLAPWTAVLTRAIVTKGQGTWYLNFSPEDSSVPLPAGMEIVPTGRRVPVLRS